MCLLNNSWSEKIPHKITKVVDCDFIIVITVVSMKKD